MDTYSVSQPSLIVECWSYFQKTFDISLHAHNTGCHDKNQHVKSWWLGIINHVHDPLAVVWWSLADLWKWPTWLLIMWVIWATSTALLTIQHQHDSLCINHHPTMWPCQHAPPSWNYVTNCWDPPLPPPSPRMCESQIHNENDSIIQCKFLLTTNMFRT